MRFNSSVTVRISAGSPLWDKFRIALKMTASASR